MALGISRQSGPVAGPEVVSALAAIGRVSGQLSPCGCTKPMSGGIRRAATIIREAQRRGPLLFLSSGGWTVGQGRQDLMKAETMAQALGSLNVSAIGLTPAEAAFGMGNVLNLNRLSGRKMIATQLDAGNVGQLHRWLSVGQFLVGAITERSEALRQGLGIVVRDPGQAEDDLSAEALAEGKRPVLIFDGNLGEAEAVAALHPEYAFILYAAQGDPPIRPRTKGPVVLLNPGDLAKHVLEITADGSGYSIADLGPQIKDDLQVAQVYSEYLNRLDSAGLLALMPRARSAPFAGSAACLACHRVSHNIWLHSLHSVAMATLRTVGHSFDPDCVPCHSVGAHSLGGFRSITETPSLASVGCESCHGPALQHARHPNFSRLSKVSRNACSSCHTSDQSPGFNFTEYWARVRHSR